MSNEPQHLASHRMRLNRRELLQYCLASAPLLCAQPVSQPLTLPFKKVGDLELRADVTGARPGKSQPGILWIHGGALIMGRRGSDISPYLMERLQGHGFVVVAIDYRLAPETKLPGMMEDIRDAWSWVCREGPAQWGIDVRRMAVGGGSAGAYLALMAGFSLEPPPKVVLSMEGFGDITGAWIREPSAHFGKLPKIGEQEARAAVGTVPIVEAPADKRRNKFTKYCRQNGLWLQEVSGHDFQREPHWFKAYCPLRNITPKYPSTILVHGDADEDVPIEQSRLLAAELTRHGVRNEFITVPGGDHGLHGFRPADYGRLYDQVTAFLVKHLS